MLFLCVYVSCIHAIKRKIKMCLFRPKLIIHFINALFSFLSVEKSSLTIRLSMCKKLIEGLPTLHE